ncbi:CsxC family protein [Clostridium sp. OS1-26]|uniref:CsxC family protein n=1 Tax=Clostridium sp. OS1-26 TaxID=3070681 RepID=UPI0035A99118
MPSSEDGKPNTGILFIDGFIRKNIEYITEECTRKGVSNRKVKHSTVKVPFKCTTRVKFKTQPKFTPTTPQDEVELLETNIRVCGPCEESVIGRDVCEQSFKFTEFFNEKVFCELISAEIVEVDILENSTNKDYKSSAEQTFHNITEKAVLFLTIKLLQNQHVEIP